MTTEQLFALTEDAQAAMHALDRTIKFYGKASSVYPDLHLARSVVERVWLAASKDAQRSLKGEGDE